MFMKENMQVFSEDLCCCTVSRRCLGQAGWHSMFLQQSRGVLVPMVMLFTFWRGENLRLWANRVTVQSCFWTPGGTWISWFCMEALCPCCSLCLQPCSRDLSEGTSSAGSGFWGEQSPGCALGEVRGCQCSAAAAEPVRGRFLARLSPGCRGAEFAHCCTRVPFLRQLLQQPSNSSATESVARLATRAVARLALPLLCPNSRGRTALSP